MNTIYTAGEVDPQALALLLKERDELRSALKARDEEIALMKDINRSLVDKANRQNIHDARQSEVLTAQRKVLEQALEALKYVAAGSYQKHAAAVTPIKEILK
jgi:RNA polymerase-binding transcription factor DksA